MQLVVIILNSCAASIVMCVLLYYLTMLVSYLYLFVGLFCVVPCFQFCLHVHGWCMLCVMSMARKDNGGPAVCLHLISTAFFFFLTDGEISVFKNICININETLIHGALQSVKLGQYHFFQVERWSLAHDIRIGFVM